MRRRMLGQVMTAALLLGVGAAGAATKESAPAPLSDQGIARRLAHEVNMYPYYTIWDAVSFRVSNGQVAIEGAVNEPFKKSDIQRIVRDIPGVTGVTDEIKVMPLSPFDDRIRVAVARAVYADPALSRFGMGPVPSIHILVDNGHVTLSGVVDTDMEKNIAAIRASGAGMSFGPVINNLLVEHPAKKS